MNAPALTPKTARQKWTKIALVMLFILTILRECGFVSLNWYRSNLSITSNSNWSNSFTNTSFPVVNGTKKSGEMTPPVIEKVAVYYEGDCVWGECDDRTVVVEIQDIDFGFIYLPIYKDCSFKANVTSNFSLSQRTRLGNDFKQRSNSCNFNQRHDGELTVKGFCSARKARELIIEAIAQRAYGDVSVKISDIQSGMNQ